MSAFEAYKDYVSLKNHFTKDSYDYFKYNGKSRLKQSSFNSRKDKIFFERLAKNEDVCGFLVANLSINPKLWIRDLAYSESAQVVYQDWKKRNQSLSYNFKNDMKKIVEEPKDQHHPAAMRLFLGGQISLESLCIFVEITNSFKVWDSKLEYDPIWEDLKMRIIKYTPFIKFDRDKVIKILLDFCE